MDNLAERLKQASDESWDTWFDRWYKKYDLERKLLISASDGSNGVVINTSKESYYTIQRLLDERFIHQVALK